MNASNLARTAAVLSAAALSVSCGAHRSGTAEPAETGSTQPAVVGRLAPSWQAPTTTGSSLSIDSLRGKAVYLNFFASWCPPCNDEAPNINALQKRYGSRGFQVVGIDIMENRQKAAQFVNEHHLVYPAVVDSGTLRSQYRINGLPVHVFIDRTGIIRRLEVGELSPQEMTAAVQSIL